MNGGEYVPSLAVLRRRRTRASNVVREIIAHNLNSPAPWKMENGLPSWWPFWSDCLYNAVREACREARLVEAAEAKQ